GGVGGAAGGGGPRPRGPRGARARARRAGGGGGGAGPRGGGGAPPRHNSGGGKEVVMRRSLAIIGSGILLSSIAWASAPGSADKQPTPALEAKHRMFRAEQGRWMPLPDLVPAGGAMRVMDGDPSQGAADFYVRFPAGYGVPMHMHTPSERLYMS